MMASEVQVRKLGPDDITEGIHGRFLSLLAESYEERIVGVNSARAARMAHGSFANVRSAMQQATEDPNAPNLYAAYIGDSDISIAFIRIGLEKAASRKDIGLLRVGMAQAAHTLGILSREDNIQIVDYALLPAYFNHDDWFRQGQGVLGKMVDFARTDFPGAETMSSYIDTGDRRTGQFMRGIDPRTYRLGKKVVDISVGGVRRPHRRGVVTLPNISA